jgi:hypothetical protein
LQAVVVENSILARDRPLQIGIATHLVIRYAHGVRASVFIIILLIIGIKSFLINCLYARESKY